MHAPIEIRLCTVTCKCYHTQLIFFGSLNRNLLEYRNLLETNSKLCAKFTSKNDTILFLYHEI